VKLKRRTFLKVAAFAGISFVVPGVSIADVIPKPKPVSFGEYMASIANGTIREAAIDSDGGFLVHPEFYKQLISEMQSKKPLNMTYTNKNDLF